MLPECSCDLELTVLTAAAEIAPALCSRRQVAPVWCQVAVTTDFKPRGFFFLLDERWPPAFASQTQRDANIWLVLQLLMVFFPSLCVWVRLARAAAFPPAPLISSD